MSTIKVQVTQIVEVTLDETKFTPEFFAEFERSFSPYVTVERHAEHLAWIQATGLEDMEGRANPFVEGYGPIKDFGISAKVIDTETEALSTLQDQTA